MTMFNALYDYQWISPTLLKFKQSGIIEISPTQRLWITSMYQTGNIPGQIFSPFLNDRLGRRNTLVFTSIPFLLAKSILFLNTPTGFILGLSRLLSGMAGGVVFASLNVYLSEISSPSIRGTIGAFPIFMACMAELTVFSLVPLLEISMSSILVTIPSVLILALSFTIPESPYFLIMQNDDTKAKNSLKKLRGGADVDEEFQIVCSYARSKESSAKLISIWTDSANRRSLFIVLLIYIAQQMTGFSIVSNYGQVILAEAPTFLTPESGGLISTVIHIITVIIVFFLVDRCGRRPLILFSTIATTIPVFAIGVYFFCKENNFSIYKSISWFPLVGYVGYKTTFTFGLVGISSLVTSELFPTHLRAFVSAAGSLIGALLAMFSLVMFTVITTQFGYWPNFLSYIVILTGSAILFYNFLPETKCKRLEDIQLELQEKVA